MKLRDGCVGLARGGNLGIDALLDPTIVRFKTIIDRWKMEIEQDKEQEAGLRTH